MANIWFVSPEETNPLTIVPRNIRVRVSWNLSTLTEKTVNPVVTLTAYPAPASITPNDGADTQRGLNVVNNQSQADFTVCYPAGGQQFNATLTVKLHLNGDPNCNPDGTDHVTVRVDQTSEGAGQVAYLQTSPATSATVKPVEGCNNVPVVLTGRTLVDDEHAAAVVCIIYRKSNGKMEIDFVTPARFLPKDLFAVILDPAARELGRCYRLNWVNELGQLMKITSDPL